MRPLSYGQKTSQAIVKVITCIVVHNDYRNRKSKDEQVLFIVFVKSFFSVFPDTPSVLQVGFHIITFRPFVPRFEYDHLVFIGLMIYAIQYLLHMLTKQSGEEFLNDSEFVGGENGPSWEQPWVYILLHIFLAGEELHGILVLAPESVFKNSRFILLTAILNTESPCRW